MNSYQTPTKSAQCQTDLIIILKLFNNKLSLNMRPLVSQQKIR